MRFTKATTARAAAQLRTALDQAGIERGAAAIAVTVTVVTLILTVTMPTQHNFRVYADEKRVVRIYVDDKRRDVVSSASSVKDVLAENGISVKAGDVVDPGIETAIDQPNYNINIYRATPAVVVDQGRFVQVVTGYRSARKIAAAAGVTLYPEDKADLQQVQDFQATSTLGYKVTVTRAVPVQLIVNGQLHSVRSHAATVGELLKEKSIEYDPADLQSVTPETQITPGLRIILAKISQETQTVIEPVEPSTQVVFDATMAPGTSRVQREGVAGRRQVTYLIEKTNGQEAKRSVLDQVTLTAAVDKVIVRGSAIVGRSQPSAEQWAQLRFCEAGGNYATNTGNGYYGAYQMNINFWQAYGDNPNILPSQASPASQDAAAQRAYALRGSNPWPVCGRFLR